MSGRSIIIEEPSEELPATCDDCHWHGTAGELLEAEGAVLTPGDPSPAGRCPVCETLAYLARPEDAERSAGPELAAALRALLKADEARHITGEESAALLEARQLGYKALKQAKP